MTYEEVAQRLSPTARLLLIWMTDRHNSASTNRFFQFIATFGGSSVVWAHGGEFETDQAELNELVDLGLLRRTAGGRDPKFEIRHDAVLFVQWLRSRGGALQAIDREAQRLVNDGDFSNRFPTSAHHLSEALELLWSDRASTEAAIVEIGTHLRSALQSLVHDVAGGRPEQANENIRRWAPTVAAEREAALLVAMVERAHGCSQRLTHIRDESAKGRPLRSMDELRRVAFLTTVVCSEVAALAPP
jgi:hypothetical protein